MCQHIQGDFPGLVSYNRFVELMQKSLLPLAVYLKISCLGKCTGISYVDSSHISACHIKRALIESVIDELKTSVKLNTLAIEVRKGLLSICYLD